jgi:hypothetical protein
MRGPSVVEPPVAPLDLVSRVESSPLVKEPFAHIYLEQVFTPDYYRRLLRSLPDTGSYRELRHRDAIQSDGRSARRRFYLFPEHVRLLPVEQRALWLEVSRALRSRALQEAFKRKFRASLERRFGRSIERLRFYPVPLLLRDFHGYRIGIHGDSLSKAITVQLYLPPDESQAHLGTQLHEARDGAGAQRITRLPFRPASGYAFPVVYHESWHSVARTQPADGTRNSIMLTYFVQDRPLDWLAERFKRWWLFAVRGLHR